MTANAETAHNATLGLAGAMTPLLPRPGTGDPRLAVRAFGLDFPNPIGLAAGFDKNAQVPDAMARSMMSGCVNLSLPDAPQLTVTHVQQLDEDILLEAYPAASTPSGNAPMYQTRD